MEVRRARPRPRDDEERETREGREEIAKLKTHARSSVHLHLAHNGGDVHE